MTGNIILIKTIKIVLFIPKYAQMLLFILNAWKHSIARLFTPNHLNM